MKRILLLSAALAPFTLGANNSYYQYVWANYNQFNEQFTQSLSEYQDLLLANPSPYVYKGYLHALHATGQWVKIISIASSIDEHFAQDIPCQMILAQAYEQTGNQNKCDEKIITLNQHAKNHQELAFAASQIYVRRKEPENALKVLDAYLNCTGDRTNNFIFYFAKSQIYVQLQKKNEALIAVKKSLELYPKFDKSWLLLALLEEQAGRIEQAAAGYSNFLQTTNDTKDVVQEHLSQLVVQYKLEHLFTKSSQPDSLFVQSQKLLQEKKFDQALHKIDECLTHESCNMRYRTAKIDILASMQKHLQAAQLLESWLLAEPEESAWYQALHLLGQHGLKKNELVGILQKIHTKAPQNALPILYLADHFLRTNDLAQAFSYLQKALPLSADAAMRLKIQYQIALIHYQKKEFGPLKKVLLDIYHQRPAFLPALNMLAYYYASKEKNLAHAYLLIEKVVLQEPTNPHYQDTKAYILYKQGNFKQASEILEQCMQQAPHDSMIQRHLAKTLFKMGKKDSAQKLLQQAINLPYADMQEKKKLTALHQRWAHGRSYK